MQTGAAAARWLEGARARLASALGWLGARRLVGLAVVLAVGSLAAWLWRHERGWAHRGEGLLVPRLGASLRFMAVPQLVRAGPPRLAVVQLGEQVRFEPRLYVNEGLVAPVSIETWAELLQAPVVFNAGQFDEHLRHLGWLKSRGRWLERGRKAAFKGLLVSAPLSVAGSPGAPGAAATRPWPFNALVDLERTDLEVADAYANVLQSMMLVDEGAQVRVRRSDLAACRTVVAEDAAGHLLILVSEGAVTLHELAAWLPHSGLGVVRAINLDGGVESQLAVHTGTQWLTFTGRYGHDNPMAVRPSIAPAPLPAVVAVFPR